MQTTITTTQAELLTEEYARARASWRKALKEGDWESYHYHTARAYTCAYIFGILGLKSPEDPEGSK